MTKSKIILASLGVVAGLGTAALPLASYAAETVSGNVDLRVDVLPAIAMTISGNNDDNAHGGSGNGAVDVFNPVEAASSDIDGHTTPAAATTVASSSWMSILPNAIGTMTSTVTVYTNNASGYTLTVADADANTNLVNGDYSIPAAAAPAAGTAGWSIEGGSLAKSAIAASDAANPLTVKTTAAKTSGGDATTMTYTVSTDEDQATGTYVDTITYTATTN